MSLKLHSILLALCFYTTNIATADSFFDPIELTDLGRSSSKHNLSQYEFSNCSNYNIAYGSSCTCFECSGGRCTICCNSPGFRCCYCHACLTTCWNNEWQLISIAQVGLSTALLVATVVTVALFFKLCNSGLQLGRQSTTGRNLVSGDSSGRASISSVQQYIIERLQDRPPQYNDLSDAPPLYDTDPAERVPTSEAPPRYTRKPQDTVNSGVQSASASSPEPIVPSAPPAPNTTANHM